MHPQVFLPEKIKNLEFFDERDNWDKGIEWYKSFFIGNGAENKVIGEVSTEYSKYPGAVGVPANMASTIPDAKLIYLVRNPLERIISHYIHMVGAAAAENRNVNDALRNVSNNPYIDYSRYYYQLKQYLPFYKKKQILIICSEDLKNNRSQTLRKLFKFIGVDPEIKIDKEVRANMRSDRKRWNHVGAIIRKSNKLYNKYNYFKSRFPQAGELADYFFSTPIQTPIINFEIREKLILTLTDDVQQLEKFSGMDFKEWNLK